MTERLTGQAAQLYVADQMDSYNVMSLAYSTASGDLIKWSTLVDCAAQLHASGWLETHALACGVNGDANDEDTQERVAREAFTECERVGIIPIATIWTFFGSWAVRQAAWWFIKALVRRYLVGGGDAGCS